MRPPSTREVAGALPVRLAVQAPGSGDLGVHAGGFYGPGVLWALSGWMHVPGVSCLACPETTVQCKDLPRF